MLDRRLRLFLFACVLCMAEIAPACPFCDALPHTLSDDLEESTAAVVARCESAFAKPDGSYVCRMRITDVLKGQTGFGAMVIEIESSQRLASDAAFWIVGFGDTPVQWTPPEEISPQAIAYVKGLSGLPESGPARLKHFLRYLRYDDEFIAADAYNEFAESSLGDIARVKDSLDREWIINQLRDKDQPSHHRRLCWTFLSQCGRVSDAKLFDELIRIRQTDPSFDPGMDAGVACLIALGGEAALERIEREYLTNTNANYSDSFAAINAIRVHGTELRVIPRDRLAVAFRHVLDRPELADLVIPDLARWKDWTAVDQVATLFESATAETSLLKPAAVRYLKTCPRPSAADALERLRTIDPEAVAKAENSMLFNLGFASIPVPPPDTQEQNANHAPRVAEKPSHQTDANHK